MDLKDEISPIPLSYQVVEKALREAGLEASFPILRKEHMDDEAIRLLYQHPDSHVLALWTKLFPIGDAYKILHVLRPPPTFVESPPGYIGPGTWAELPPKQSAPIAPETKELVDGLHPSFPPVCMFRRPYQSSWSTGKKVVITNTTIEWTSSHTERVYRLPVVASEPTFMCGYPQDSIPDNNIHTIISDLFDPIYQIGARFGTSQLIVMVLFSTKQEIENMKRLLSIRYSLSQQLAKEAYILRSGVFGTYDTRDFDTCITRVFIQLHDEELHRPYLQMNLIKSKTGYPWTELPIYLHPHPICTYFYLDNLHHPHSDTKTKLTITDRQGFRHIFDFHDASLREWVEWELTELLSRYFSDPLLPPVPEKKSICTIQ